MLRYKVTPPALPDCIDRPRLLRRVETASIVVLAAPGGHGKTCLAAQIAEATGGPVAWFVADEMDRDRAGVVIQLFAALETAWPDLAVSARTSVDDDSAVARLAAALETLVGPGAVVLDDVHLLPRDVVDPIVRVAAATLPDDIRLVIGTRGVVPEPILRAEAMSRAVTLGAADLAFDDEECSRLCRSDDRGAELRRRTGGWPLAVALAGRDGWPSLPRPGRLAELALRDMSPAGRRLLVVLGRLPRFPARLLRRLGDPYPGAESIVRDHGWLLSRDGDWWAPREWLRDSLSAFAADPEATDVVVRALENLDAPELAAHLLLAEARYEDAVPLVERLATDGMRHGRAAWVSALIRSVPSSARTFRLDLLAATAAQALNVADAVSADAGSERKLLELEQQAETEGPSAQLQVRALLASHYRMEADPRYLAVCERALGDALDVGPSPARWSPEDRPAAAELLRLYGYGLLFARRGSSVERGRRLVATAFDLLDTGGHPTISLRGWFAYFEVLLFLRAASDGVRQVRSAAYQLATLDHSDATLRLAELATVQFFAGDRAGARRAIEMARESAACTGNRIVLLPVAAVEAALDVLDDGPRPEHLTRFDEIVAQLGGHPRLAPFQCLVAAEFGIVLARMGHPDPARRYLAEAERVLGTDLFAPINSLRCRRLRGLIAATEGRSAEARDLLDGVRREAIREGRPALVDLITSDVAELVHVPAPVDGRTGEPAPPILVRVLGPELTVMVGDDVVPPPRGFPAKLLALLVASNGSMTLDAAIEGLWPGAHPDVGRNRLHGVLLRLRRSLGLPATGPIRCTEGTVHLDARPDVVVDAWEFERLATAAHTDPQAAVDCVAAYTGDVLSVQFAYDDTIAGYRRALRHTFLRLASMLLAHPAPPMSPDQLAALARRVPRIAPDDDAVVVAAARALARLDRRAEALDVLEEALPSLAEAGFDADELRRRVDAELHLTPPAGSGAAARR